MILETVDQVQARLERRIAGLGSVIVALSGGVDSSVVAALAARALGDRALAVTGRSAALATGELDGAREVARAIGIRHETITTDELGRADYRRNDGFRCFHCKTELYAQLTGLAGRRGYAHVVSGANADDAGDWRPGLRAAADHRVGHPLLEEGVGKPLVRALAAHLGVPSAEKPASPCLASRIPYGTPVDAATLDRIDRAEQAVRALGHRHLRVRHLGELGRLELAGDELDPVLAEPSRRRALEAAVRSAGYARAIVAEPAAAVGFAQRCAGHPTAEYRRRRMSTTTSRHPTVDADLELLSTRAAAWAGLPIAEKRALVCALHEATADVARRLGGGRLPGEGTRHADRRWRARSGCRARWPSSSTRPPSAGRSTPSPREKAPSRVGSAGRRAGGRRCACGCRSRVGIGCS